MNAKSPVLLLVFNRPRTTKRVFQSIREAQPTKLYIAADGPREDRKIEAELCEEVRNIVINVDWECEVQTLFREENLGCKYAVSGAIDWFFSHEEMGIILEDDCLPNPSFFKFCDKMLTKYRNDSRIMTVSGTNNLGKWKNDVQDYHFSVFGSIWGWATWRRAWDLYDIEMTALGDDRIRDVLRYAMIDDYAFNKRFNALKRVYNGEVDTWDYQWFLARAINSGLSVVPSVNLVSNIGFGEDATHTTDSKSKSACLPTFSLEVKEENKFIVPDRDYDKKIIPKLGYLERIKRKIVSIF